MKTWSFWPEFIEDLTMRNKQMLSAGWTEGMCLKASRCKDVLLSAEQVFAGPSQSSPPAWVSMCSLGRRNQHLGSRMDRSYRNVPGKWGKRPMGSQQEGQLPQVQFPTWHLEVVGTHTKKLVQKLRIHERLNQSINQIMLRKKIDEPLPGLQNNLSLRWILPNDVFLSLRLHDPQKWQVFQKKF